MNADLFYLYATSLLLLLSPIMAFTLGKSRSMTQAMSCLLICFGTLVLSYGIIHTLTIEIATALLYPVGIEYMLDKYRPFCALITMVLIVRLSLQSFDLSIQKKIATPLNTFFLVSYFMHLVLISYLVSINGFKPFLASAYLGLDAIAFIGISDKVTLLWNKYFNVKKFA